MASLTGAWAKEDGDASDGSNSEASAMEEEVKIDYASQRAILLGRSVTAMFLVDVSNTCHYLTPCRQTKFLSSSQFPSLIEYLSVFMKTLIRVAPTSFQCPLRGLRLWEPWLQPL